VVDFSGALELAPAQTVTDYHLVAASKGKKSGNATGKPVALKSAVYDPATDSVALVPKGTVPKQPLQLTITATGTLDAEGRPIDGNRDGQPGGDFQVSFKGSGIQLSGVGEISAAAVDALLAAEEPRTRLRAPAR
jgi:hypothetical protein